jgi:cytochrome c-type biogenesis protein CcmH/NrfG
VSPSANPPPAAEPVSPKVRRGQLVLGLIVLVVLAVNFALFLLVSERDDPDRRQAPPAATPAAPAAGR